MGCVDSRNGSASNDIQIHRQKMLQNSHQTHSKKQDLTISDHEAFLKKSKEDGKVDYPTVFKFVKISPMTDSQISQVSKQDLKCLNCTRNQLIQVSTLMMFQTSFAKSNLQQQTLKALISEIAKNYNSVSYHNFTHGFALMQMVYKCFKMDKKLQQTYTQEEKLYYLLAGITHDVNHNATNNGFQVKLNTNLAKIAENESVLQKMHLRTFFQICRNNPQLDIVSKSTNAQVTKQKITRVILATDMARHFKLLQKIQKPRIESGEFNFKSDQNKIVFMQNLVHACDIGNALLPTQQYLSWGGILSYQFNQQTKQQAKLNVPVTQFLKYKGLNGFYDDQIGFLGTFVVPLWKQICLNIQGIKKIVQNSQKNLEYVKQLKQKQKN